MRLLDDAQLSKLISLGELARGVSDPGKQIKACSLDLSIGLIYIPGTKKKKLGSVDQPRTEYSLRHGETAVIRTKETVALNASRAGVAFPASGVSLLGLLMTNPGHLDPGYEGHLHVTVINMAKDPYHLREGDRLLRSLFFELDQPAKKPFVPIPGYSPINEQLLDRLSRDFLSVESRAEEAAKRAVDRADFRFRWAQVVTPVLIALASVAGAWFATTRTTEERFSQIEARVPLGLESRVTRIEAVGPIKDRINALETRTLVRLEERIAALEKAQSKK